MRVAAFFTEISRARALIRARRPLGDIICPLPESVWGCQSLTEHPFATLLPPLATAAAAAAAAGQSTGAGTSAMVAQLRREAAVKWAGVVEAAGAPSVKAAAGHDPKAAAQKVRYIL